MKSFTRTNLKTFRDEFESTIKDLEEKLGVKIDLGNISFSPNSFTTKMSVRIADGKTDDDLAKEDFKKYSPMFGLDESYFGKRFVWNEEFYTISGIKHRSRKYPIIATRELGGQKYKFDVDAVKDRVI